MAFDYKKEYKEFYLPPRTPGLVTVPKTNYLAVRGHGDPNEPDGSYKASIGLLYGIAFAIKMSPRSGHAIPGYFSYVVPPLEGLWQQGLPCDPHRFDPTRKEELSWISMIRLPEFVTRETFDWAIREAEKKKQTDFSSVEFFTYEEGLCVQCMHIGSYDDEPETLARMQEYTLQNDCVSDLSPIRLHHEIYLSDPRRCAPQRLRTVIRQPVKRR